MFHCVLYCDSSPVPDVPDTWYFPVLYTIGAIHNIFCIFVVITYFLASRPKPPSINSLIKRTKYDSYLSPLILMNKLKNNSLIFQIKYT